MNTIARIRGVHYAWIVIAAAFVATLIASGVRSTYGVFVLPLQDEFQTTRASIALVGSVNILVNGLVQPVVGRLLDKYGPRAVALVSLLIAICGVLATSYVTELWQLYITIGIVIAAAVGGPSSVMATVLAARWFVKQRGLVVAILSAAISAGQLVLIYSAMQLYIAFGWRQSYLYMALGVVVFAVPFALLIRDDPKDVGQQPYGAGSEGDAASLQSAEHTIRTPISRALGTHGFWMLALGFFICGYTTAGMIGTHLIAYTTQSRGIAPETAAAAMGLMGLVNIAGTLISGVVTDRMGRKNPLAAIYFVRGLALIGLIFVDDSYKLFAFAVVFGLAYIATVPPTSALTAQLFGRMSVGAIFGVIFMGHQIGGAFGSYLTGWIYDLTGSYQQGFLLGAVLCFVAAAASFSIREEVAIKPVPAAALD